MSDPSPTRDAELARLAELLPAAWSSDSAGPWSADNPARGQCSVTALLVHDLFGGEIMKTRVGGAWHFYNRLDGRRIDLTAGQFARCSREAISGTTPP